MRKAAAAKALGDDNLAARILSALKERELTYDQVVALGDTPRHAAAILDTMQVTRLMVRSCGPIQPSTCMYRLAANGLKTEGRL